MGWLSEELRGELRTTTYKHLQATNFGGTDGTKSTKGRNLRVRKRTQGLKHPRQALYSYAYPSL